jgi:hypothetical protein
MMQQNIFSIQKRTCFCSSRFLQFRSFKARVIAAKAKTAKNTSNKNLRSSENGNNDSAALPTLSYADEAVSSSFSTEENFQSKPEATSTSGLGNVMIPEDVIKEFEVGCMLPEHLM